MSLAATDQSQNGVTLVELLVLICVVAVLSLVARALILSFQANTEPNTSTAPTHNDAM